MLVLRASWAAAVAEEEQQRKSNAREREEMSGNVNLLGQEMREKDGNCETTRHRGFLLEMGWQGSDYTIIYNSVHAGVCGWVKVVGIMIWPLPDRSNNVDRLAYLVLVSRPCTKHISNACSRDSRTSGVQTTSIAVSDLDQFDNKFSALTDSTASDHPSLCQVHINRPLS